MEFSSPDSVTSDIPSVSDRDPPAVSPETPPTVNQDGEWMFSHDGNLMNSQAGTTFEIADEILKLQIHSTTFPDKLGGTQGSINRSNDLPSITSKSKLVATAPSWHPSLSVRQDLRPASVLTDVTATPENTFNRPFTSNQD